MKAYLKDKNGKIICNFPQLHLKWTLRKRQYSCNTLVQEPRKWTAETPELYTLGLELSNPAGLQKDKIETVIGFKKTEIKDGVFYLNGIPLKVNAQNSHMQHPEEGHVMDEATIRKDFELLKQFNFNAVRTLTILR